MFDTVQIRSSLSETLGRVKIGAVIHDQILFSKFSGWKFTLDKAQGCYLTDQTGHKLLDFTSGWNVTNLGWNNREIAHAAQKALQEAGYVPGWADDRFQIELAQKLTAALPSPLNTAARATGGTEANEEAIKTARAYTGRRMIVSFKETYHGHSLATLALGYDHNGALARAVGPFPADFLQLDFPKEGLETFGQKLEKVLSTNEVAAVLTEAGVITGWGSTALAPQGYLALVRGLTQKYGTLLILDEVGTGFSRCGQLFGFQIENVTPDIVTLAKGLSNGVAPIGAMVATQEIAEKTAHLTNIYSTFGWLPVACAAAQKTLAIHLRDKVWQKAETDGKYLRETLEKELNQKEKCFDIRGLGMETGVTYLGPTKGEKSWADKIVETAYQKGLHLVSDHENNLQLMPPLTISRRELDLGLTLLVAVIKTLK